MSVRSLVVVSDAPERPVENRFDVLPAALAGDAGCLFDPELHDGPGDHAESADERAAREAVAVAVCGDCPLMASCDRYVQRVQPPSGVWAGLTPDERDDQALAAELAEVA